ncbi:hypothetical protein OIO90_002752 [Microbotryomycetes sp. JL221]|nr:hypothetical protein OIO90_002752 [Microbotryomycetes sp. JL221]
MPSLKFAWSSPASRGDLVQVVGPKQSGRSAIVLHITLSYLLQHPHVKATFLHTFPAFEPLAFRARDLLQDLVARAIQRGDRFERDGVPLDIDQVAISVLERLNCTRVLTAAEALASLESEIALSKESPDNWKLSIVIIDSIEVLLGGDAVQSSSAEGHAIMVDFMARLKAFSKDPALPFTAFLVNSLRSTSQQASAGTAVSQLPVKQPVKPCLGATFAHMVDATLWTTKVDKAAFKMPISSQEIKDNTDMFIIELVKDKGASAGDWTGFRLINGTRIEALK